MKKLVTFIVVLSMLSSYALAFSDVDMASDEGQAIIKMQNCGYIQGFGDNTFRPNDTLTRAQFVTIINKMYGYTLSTDNVFKDIKPGEWYYNDVLIAVQAGYIQGYDDGTFKPNNRITREQVCVMMNRILKTELIPFGQNITDTVSDWARDSVEKLVSNRFFLLEEGGKFRALQPITRSETCVALEKCVVDVPINIEPVNLNAMLREELLSKLQKIVGILETKVMPNLKTEVMITVSKMLLASIKKYIANPDYDYLPDAKATYDVYKTSGPKSAEFKDLIYKNMYLDEIMILFDFFYTPEIDGRN